MHSVISKANENDLCIKCFNSAGMSLDSVGREMQIRKEQTFEASTPFVRRLALFSVGVPRMNCSGSATAYPLPVWYSRRSRINVPSVLNNHMTDRNDKITKEKCFMNKRNNEHCYFG